jgi:hypothetical protein
VVGGGGRGGRGGAGGMFLYYANEVVKAEIIHRVYW